MQATDMGATPTNAPPPPASLIARLKRLSIYFGNQRLAWSLAIVATLVPFSAAEIGDKVPMIVIFIVLVLIGEVVRVVSAKGRKEEYKGLTPELAAQRLAEEAAEAEEN